MTPTDTEAIYVLHVDDDPEFGALTGQFLEREDDRMEVYTVTNPDEGIAVLRQWDIDCVVCDYEMGDRDGLEFRRIVHAADPELPFILYTAHEREAVGRAALSDEAIEYLQKRGGKEQYAVLTNRIAAAVERRRAESPVLNSP